MGDPRRMLQIVRHPQHLVGPLAQLVGLHAQGLPGVDLLMEKILVDLERWKIGVGKQGVHK